MVRNPFPWARRGWALIFGFFTLATAGNIASGPVNVERVITAVASAGYATLLLSLVGGIGYIYIRNRRNSKYGLVPWGRSGWAVFGGLLAIVFLSAVTGPSQPDIFTLLGSAIGSIILVFALSRPLYLKIFTNHFEG